MSNLAAELVTLILFIILIFWGICKSTITDRISPFWAKEPGN